MSDGIFTVRIGADKQQKLDAIAQQLDRSRNYLVSKAIDDFLDLYTWQVAEIRQGLSEADANQFATNEEVEMAFKRYQDAN